MINDPYYDPTRLTPPPTSSLSAVDKKTPEYLQLQEAFDIAPPFFKDLLCGLKGVYITANGSTYPSWGFRDPSTVNNPSSDNYIGISHDLWQPDALGNLTAINLTTYLTDAIVQPLLVGLKNLPYFDYARPDDYKMMLLTAMAHEFGHVLWVNMFVEKPGNDPNFANANFCSGQFATVSWSTPIKWVSWRNFGDIADTPLDVIDANDFQGAPDDPSYKEINVRTLKSLIYKQVNAQNLKGSKLRLRSRSNKVYKVIDRLLNSTKRSWPSLFGAFSANEDFVETFTLYVQTTAKTPLKNLRMKTYLPSGGSSIDIPYTLDHRGDLMVKIKCFDNYFNPSGIRRY